MSCCQPQPRTSPALIAVLAVAACSGTSTPGARPIEPARAAPAAVVRPETVAADVERTTTVGTRYLVPAGWTVTATRELVVLEAPERGSMIAIVEPAAATSSDDALGHAWRIFRPHAIPKVAQSADAPDEGGWTAVRHIVYASAQPATSEPRFVIASPRFASGRWAVIIVDVAKAVIAKRSAQFDVIVAGVVPGSYKPVAAVARHALPLDASRIAAWTAFADRARAQLRIPGIGLGLIEHGRVVFRGGFGVRKLGSSTPASATTRFLIASNTKLLTGLLLAKLVDAGRFSWDTPVADLWPSWRLGDDATTRAIRLKHLLCACTGVPRIDAPWLFEAHALTPERIVAIAHSTPPTAKLGEVFQYSNLLAAAAGYLGAHAADASRELGAAYDEAMRTQVFEPLGMRATTLDFDVGARDAAHPHGETLDGAVVALDPELNRVVVPLRAAGGVWSTVDDLLAYVRMELAGGMLPDGTRYIAAAPLLARRVPQIAVGAKASYGTGMLVDRRYGETVITHGGEAYGLLSAALWLPDHDVGAVIWVNATQGGVAIELLIQRLIEVLFDGPAKSEARLVEVVREAAAERAGRRKALVIPARLPAGIVAGRYAHPTLGDVVVRRRGPALELDFGEFRSEVASKQNPDGSTSLIVVGAGLDHLELVARNTPNGRTLSYREGDQTNVFAEVRGREPDPSP